MKDELSGRRIVVPETRELGQLIHMLQQLGADAVLDLHGKMAVLNG